MLLAGSWQQHTVDLVLVRWSSVWLLLGLSLLHLCFRLTSPREKSLPVLEGAAATPLRTTASKSQRGLVVVTGGTGFLGSAIVRQLVQRGRSVCVIDRVLPSTERRVDGVAYANFLPSYSQPNANRLSLVVAGTSSLTSRTTPSKQHNVAQQVLTQNFLCFFTSLLPFI